MPHRELQTLPAGKADLLPGPETAVPRAEPEGTLKLACRKCTRTEYFHGVNRGVANVKAQAAGWRFTLDRGEICPRCPGTTALPPAPEGTLQLTCSKCGTPEPYRGTNRNEAVMRAQSAGWRLLPSGQVCARCLAEKAPPKPEPTRKRLIHV